MSTLQKKVMPLWFKFLVISSIVALIFVMGGILFTESWVGVVESQLQEIKEGDIRQAYYQYTSKDFQAITPFDKFQAFVLAHPIFFTNPKVQFPSRGLNKNISTLRGKFVDLNRKSTPVEYQLIKEEGSWKILSIHFIEKSSESND